MGYNLSSCKLSLMSAKEVPRFRDFTCKAGGIKRGLLAGPNCRDVCRQEGFGGGIAFFSEYLMGIGISTWQADECDPLVILPGVCALLVLIEKQAEDPSPFRGGDECRTLFSQPIAIYPLGYI